MSDLRIGDGDWFGCADRRDDASPRMPLPCHRPGVFDDQDVSVAPRSLSVETCAVRLIYPSLLA
jgi:hypothetical protein